MLTSPPSALRVAGRLLIVIAFLFCTKTWGRNWDAPAQDFAAKIFAITGPAAISVETVNRSSLDNIEVETIRRMIMDRLSASGASLVSAERAAASVKVSLSENLRDYVWVAEIRRGMNDPVVVMFSTQRPPATGALNDAPALTIRKTLLWSSDQQILNADIINGALPRMVVLHPTQIRTYKLEVDHWIEDQSFSFTHSPTWPRDLRGRLVLHKDHGFDAYLPGWLCQSSAPSAVTCHASDDPWPISTGSFLLNAFFAGSRNFFTGGLTSGIGKQTTVPAFYSMAPIPREKYTLWFLAATDGRVHMLDGTSDTIAGKLDWGSDIATVRSRCGSGWQILTMHNGTVQEDIVQAFEVSDRQPVAVGQSTELPGGVTSLWTDADEDGAIAVVHNFQTGKYEAYLLTIACGL